MTDPVKKTPFMAVLYSGFRRRFFVFFRPRYVIRSLLGRKGNCKKCGRCCSLNKAWCFDFKDNKCLTYDRQPFFCKVFPIDHKDKEMSGVSEECGYWWGDDGKG